MSPRKLLIVALGLGILAAPLAVGAQQPRKIPRIGYLVLASLLERPSPERAAFLFDPLTSGYRVIVSDFALKNRLPTIFGAREFVAAGGLMSYGANVPELFRRAAVYVDKILKGARPEDLPIEQPTKFELIVNLKTAKALGLTIPPSVLIRADQVVQ